MNAIGYRSGDAVSWLSAQGVKVYGVVTYAYNNGTTRVMLPSGQTISLLTTRLTAER